METIQSSDNGANLPYLKICFYKESFAIVNIKIIRNFEVQSDISLQEPIAGKESLQKISRRRQTYYQRELI